MEKGADPLLHTADQPPIFRKVYLILGWSMVGHYAYSVGWCFYNGLLEELLWISHVGTLVGGMGILLKNRLFISVGLVSLLEHHIFWILETLTWLLSGKFPFGTTSYLQSASIWGWLQSANHFYAVPGLLLIAFWEGGIKKHSWLCSGMLFALLALISFFLLPPASNVNSVHTLWEGLDKTVLSPLNQLPSWQFPIAIILLNVFGNYLPVYIILRLFFRWIHRNSLDVKSR